MARTDPRPHYGAKRRVGANGYIDLWKPGHPLARADGYVFEHRYVAWEAGIITSPSEHVHHRNGDKQDNRPENLEATDVATHARMHAELAGVIVNQYGTWPVKPRALRSSQVETKPELTCRHCGRTFRARRDALYCGAACRSAYRRRAYAETL